MVSSTINHSKEIGNYDILQTFDGCKLINERYILQNKCKPVFVFLRYHAHAPPFITNEEEEENKGIWCSYLEVNEASLPLIQLQIGSVPRQ